MIYFIYMAACIYDHSSFSIWHFIIFVMFLPTKTNVFIRDVTTVIENQVSSIPKHTIHLVLGLEDFSK